LHVDAISPADPLYGNYPCSPGRHWVNFPYERDYPPADQTQHTTDTDAPFVTVSGEAGNRLYCRVAPRGTAFEVTAEITGYAEFEGQKLRPTVLTLSIPAISADQADGLGSIAIQDNEFPSEFSDTGCVFSTQGGTLGVEAGRLWAKVKCDYLMGRSSIGQACRIDTGFVLLENCTQ
jgi:hypothetical protein